MENNYTGMKRMKCIQEKSMNSNPNNPEYIGVRRQDEHEFDGGYNNLLFHQR